jgi:hypothetical protein
MRARDLGIIILIQVQNSSSWCSGNPCGRQVFDPGPKQLFSLPAPWWRFPLPPSENFAQLLSVNRVARLPPSQSV